MDCMEFMASQLDKSFDIAIVDPEFGHFIKPSNNSFLHTTKMDGIRNTLDINKGTGPEYFLELRRVSKFQIVWGGNYFFDYLGSTPGLIIWDKMIYVNTSMNWCEIAWQNIRQQTRIFKFHSGMNDDIRIHPNQKPTFIYRWLIENYVKPGQSIFDSHVGSGSIRIACYDAGIDFTGTELSKDYFEGQEKRFANHIAQGRLFEPSEIRQPTQEQLF